ncbi:VOC family protein [Paenibacillus psychroresistens]|uniref:VOC family protein n=1 Tax=Paenibacillus psychroresistens TaxID=1778678 RepID=A0A6B8RSL9_9BACL|nr:VOC family protein [Paenibacillus psychroresistens]QGQ98907.1 VOC family protein [Paenibacillus psychroresistens]
MKLLQIRLLTEDFKKSTAFYRDVLALPVLWYEESMEYALFDNGETKIELLSMKAMNEAIGETNECVPGAPSKFLLNFKVDDVDATYAELLDKGVVFITEPQDKAAWNARVAHFRDPDGNLIELYKTL